MVWIAGVDGCRAGWFAVLREVETGKTQHAGPLNHISDVLALPQEPRIIGVDIPIGLPDHAERGGRECDRVARALLGKRGCCVFSPPVRAALAHCDNYEAAKQANRASSDAQISLSRQAFSISKKITQVDHFITPAKQKRIKEVHPELSFYELNKRRPIFLNKRDVQGEKERVALLREGRFAEITDRLQDTRRPGVERDDILDACAACWTAERILSGLGVCIPDSPIRDHKQLRMEIWR